MANRDTLVVAAAQYPLDAATTDFEWRDKIEGWVSEGAKTGADILVFPEYASLEQAAIMGPEVASDLQATLKAVSELAGERVAFYVEMAARHKVHILAGSGPTAGEGGRYFNAAQLITPQGLVGEQTKAILTPFEHAWGITAGGPLKVFNTVLGRIGIAICYDCEFPLQVRRLAEAGVELLLIPSCTELVSGFHRIRTGARARALENQIACVTSPTIGEARWSPAVDFNTGAAGIYVPSEHSLCEDGVLAEGELNRPGWITAEIDFRALRALRAGGEMRNFLDWSLQPGAGKPDDTGVEVADLIAG
ncbi:MAG: carbon-nitrogen hydrolase family protein [Alphaproteobacteria bacterium]|nr:carbon-nitrogen hydrolase family protein [Alphaproteobacteria bacterium]